MIEVNTILSTKDGRRIGNAVVTAKEENYWLIKPDYGNEAKLTTSEILELFYLKPLDK